MSQPTTVIDLGDDVIQRAKQGFVQVLVECIKKDVVDNYEARYFNGKSIVWNINRKVEAARTLKITGASVLKKSEVDMIAGFISALRELELKDDAVNLIFKTFRLEPEISESVRSKLLLLEEASNGGGGDSTENKVLDSEPT